MSQRPRTIRLTGAALAAARKYNDVVDEHRKEVEAIRDEANQRIKEASLRTHLTAKNLWAEIVAPNGLDPSETWGVNKWNLDTTYLSEHGEAFLFEVPQSPFEHMVASAEAADIGDRPLPGTRLN